MVFVSFIDIEETNKDLIIVFAIDTGYGDIKTLMLHRTLFFENNIPEEERGTKVSPVGVDLANDHLSTLECITFDDTVLKIQVRLSYHEINLRKIDLGEIEQIKTSLILHNYDERFEVKVINQ